MSYEALTRRIEELTEKADTPIPSCTCDSRLQHRPFCKRREARDVRDRAYIDLDVPHEMADVALAAVRALAQDENEMGPLAECPACLVSLHTPSEHYDDCWYVALGDALDALQAVMLP